MRSMFRTALVALLAVFVLSAVVASTAAAAGDEYLWKVKGVQLGTGAAKNIVSKNAAGTVVSWKFTLGTSSFTIKCSKVGEEGRGNIKGNKGSETAGAGEATLTFTECELVGDPKCVVTLTPAKIHTEIVEILEKGKEKGLSLAGLLLTPREGNFFHFTSKGAECGLKFTNVGVSGSTVAEISPQETEAKVAQLIWNAHSNVIVYENAKDKTSAAGLTWAGNPAELDARLQVELESKEEFGAFGPAL